MFKNYFIVTFRNLLHRKSVSAINIAGLTIGLSCFFIISMLVWDELSFDRFHPNADRIVRLTLDAQLEGKDYKMAKSSGPVRDALLAECPEIETATHFRGAGGGGTTRNYAVRYQDKVFSEWLLFFADSTFFKVFQCQVVEGDIRTFLTEPNTIVLTDEIARKYFGDSPALGKMLLLDGTMNYMVCGVVKSFPKQSHWHFDFLASSISFPFVDNDQWINNNWYTYALLKKGASREQAEQTFQSVVTHYAGPLLQQLFSTNWNQIEEQGYHYQYRFQPITDIHLHSHLDQEIFPSSDISLIVIFILIAVLILMIALINFMNLSTARAMHRAKEVGVRKVLGSQKSQLIPLFLGEAITLTGLAAICSLGLMTLVLPSINGLTDKSLSLAQFFSLDMILILVVFVMVVGILAGSYPAFFLSSFQPASVLKGKMRAGMHGKKVRSLLVVTQFTISIALIIATLIAYQQLLFVKNRDLGFHQDHVIVVDNTWLLGNRTESFKNILLNKPGVLAAAYTQNLPGNDIGSAAYRREEGNNNDLMMLRQLWCDQDYLETMGIQLRKGRYFNTFIASDSTDAVIINESTAKLLGYADPVGHNLIGFFGNREKQLQIIGLTADFHYEPLHLAIAPMVIHVHNGGSPTRIVLRIRGDIPQIVKEIQTLWDSFSGGQPFSCYFLSDHLQAYYNGDVVIGKLFGILAGLGVFVSCLGLLGLAMYAAEQRTKEIGIRKVLGASTTGVVGLLSWEFIKLVMIANLIAWPIAYYWMHNWLQNYTYHVKMSWWIFVLAGGLAFIIAMGTTCIQAIRAARANPVESLHYE